MEEKANIFSKRSLLEKTNWQLLLPFFTFDYLTLRLRNQTQAESFLKKFELDFQNQYGRKLRRLVRWAKRRYIHGRPAGSKIEVALIHYATEQNHSSQLQFIGPVAQKVFEHLVERKGAWHVLDIQSISRYDVRLDSSYLLKEATQKHLEEFYQQQKNKTPKWRHNSHVDCVQHDKTGEITVYIGKRNHPKTTQLKRFYIGTQKTIQDTELDLSF